jgi:hypothetical protein
MTKKDSRFHSYIVEDSRTGYQTGLAKGPEDKPYAFLTNVHLSVTCTTHHCFMHNTGSPHSLSMEPAVWNFLMRRIDRECSHSVIHPDKDDEDYHISVGDTERVHDDCDGCCAEEGFLGLK